MTLLEQNPRWRLVPRGQAVNLRCILKNSQYPWMSWYQQDLQKQLQWLFTLRSPGDKEVKSLPGADYLATRVTDTELRLQVANMSQGRTLYCTCSADTVVNSAGALKQKPHTDYPAFQALLLCKPFWAFFLPTQTSPSPCASWFTTYSFCAWVIRWLKVRF